MSSALGVVIVSVLYLGIGDFIFYGFVEYGVMSLLCGEFEVLPKSSPIVWQLVDDLVVFRLRFQGSMSHSFSSFLQRGILSGWLQKNISRRGGVGNVGYKRIRPFTYDSIATFFDDVPVEVRKETLLLESKEVGDRPYLSDFEVVGEDMKWVPDPRRFRKRPLYFLNSLDLH